MHIVLYFYGKLEKFDMILMVSCFNIQVNLSVSGRDFKLTLIARRSRHFAGTRFVYC